MPFRLTLATLIAPLLLTSQLLAQAAPQQPVNPAQPRTQASLALGNALQQVSIASAHLRRTLTSVNVPKWKAPGDIRQTTASDVDSMQRDVSDTLPSLINTALADPAKISPAFSVYRNVDALYDVLLRVSETAQLAGSNDARMLEEQRAALEDARTQFGDRARAVNPGPGCGSGPPARRRRGGSAPAPAKTVVDDGPATKSKSTTTKKKGTTHKPATTPPAPAPTTPQ